MVLNLSRVHVVEQCVYGDVSPERVLQRSAERLCSIVSQRMRVSLSLSSYDLCRYPTVTSIFLTPQIDEIELSVKYSRFRSLEMLRPVGIPLDFGDLLYGNVLHGPAVCLELFREGQAHHLLECDVDIIAL